MRMVRWLPSQKIFMATQFRSRARVNSLPHCVRKHNNQTLPLVDKFYLRSFVSAIMPREHRKRGKRKKNEIQNEEQEMDVDVEQEATEQLPSWIEPATLNETINPEAPFGFCDPDVKAYFRTVEKQLREWQELGIAEKESDTVEDPNLGTSLLACFLPQYIFSNSLYAF